MVQQTTSTLIALGNSMSNYTWDTIIGMFFSGGMALFFLLIVIIFGVISLAIHAFRNVIR